jgi:2,5-dihydroxypyridine 5,6-dioxygenase
MSGWRHDLSGTEARVLSDRIEGKWLESFARVFALCKLEAGDAVAVLSETQSRALNVQLAELALHRLGARAFHVVLPTPPQRAPVPVRSTGASDAVQGLKPAIAALAAATLVVDLTVEGMLHAPELPEILKGGARLLMVSNEHPEALERLVPDPADTPKVKEGMRLLRAARRMTVTSEAGTDLTVTVEGAPVGAVWGYCEKPGQVAHWPGGLVLCFPKAGTVNGTLMLAPGDANLTFKRYLERPVRLVVENDYVTRIEGEGLDAELMRSYIAAWGDREAYAASHVGWGMNARARWEALALYDKRDTNGTELRAFAGNFLYSTGANETAGRHTLGHFDLPMRNCTVALDGKPVVVKGALQPPLA